MRTPPVVSPKNSVMSRTPSVGGRDAAGVAARGVKCRARRARRPARPPRGRACLPRWRQSEQSPSGYTVPQLAQGFLQPRARRETSKPQRLQVGRAGRPGGSSIGTPAGRAIIGPFDRPPVRPRTASASPNGKRSRQKRVGQPLHADRGVGPCPLWTTVESGSDRNWDWMVPISVAWSPPGRSVRPIEPLNSTSPPNTQSSPDEAHAARRMAGRVPHVELEAADPHRRARLELARRARGRWLQLHAHPRAELGQGIVDRPVERMQVDRHAGGLLAPRRRP